MTEQEWLTCEDALEMLLNVIEVTDTRKLVLFAIACCRSHPSMMAYSFNKLAVEHAEKLVEGAISLESEEGPMEGNCYLQGTEANRCMAAAVRFAQGDDSGVREYVTELIEVEYDSCEEIENRTKELSHLLRDIIGNPIHPVTCNSIWFTPVVIALAQTMYDACDFASMPVLGDALEEAGCATEDILAHCRNGKMHVRGCWVVDLILAK